MNHLGRRAYLKLLLSSILVFFFLQGAVFKRQDTSPIAPADIIILVDRSKSLDFVYKDVVDSVRFTLRYLETFDPNGSNFRVSVIPFAGDVKADTTLEYLRPGFWKGFENEFSIGIQDNTDFSRAFCQLQRTMANQQGPGIDRQVIVFLFSDGESFPFGDTFANDRRFQDCFSDIPGIPTGYKTPILDSQFAVSIFENIITRNFSQQKPTLYTVAFQTPEHVKEDVNGSWWRDISSDYVAFCEEENGDGFCIKTDNKPHLVDFLNKVLASNLSGLQFEPFRKSDSTTVEIQPNRYTMEMRVSILGKDGVSLDDPHGNVQQPIKSEVDFLIYKIFVEKNDFNKTWLLTLPKSTDYRVDYINPAIRIVTLPRFAWAGHPFEFGIESVGQGNEERLPEEITVRLVDNQGRLVSESVTNLIRTSSTKWTGTLNLETRSQSGPYSIQLADKELDRLIADGEAKRLVDVLNPSQLGIMVPTYEPSTKTWIVMTPILNIDALPSYPTVEANAILVGREDVERKIPAEIKNGRVMIILDANKYPAGVYLFNLKLNSGISKWGLTPEEYRSFPIKLYVIPTIEKVNGLRRSVELTLSNYFPYEGLYIEVVNENKEVRRSDKLICKSNDGLVKCLGNMPPNREDINSDFRYSKVVLIGELASDNEIFLAESPQTGILGSVSWTEVLLSWFEPIIIPLLQGLLAVIGLAIVYYIVFTTRVSPQARAQKAIVKVNKPGAAGRGDTKKKLYSNLLRVGRIPLWNRINQVRDCLIVLVRQEAFAPTLDLTAFEIIEDAISREFDDTQRGMLNGVFKQAIADLLLLPVPNLIRFYNIINHDELESFKIIDNSDVIKRADWFSQLNGRINNIAIATAIGNSADFYRHLLGIMGRGINLIGVDPLINQIIIKMTGKTTIRPISIQHFESEVVLDFEVPDGYLSYSNVRINPSILYLTCSPDIAKNETRAICIGEFGLHLYQWGTPLSGTKLRLIIPSSNVTNFRISVGITGITRRGNEILLLSLTTLERDAGDRNWFDNNVIRNAWGGVNPRNINRIASCVQQRHCNNYYGLYQGFIQKYYLANGDDSVENIIRFAGWKALSPDNTSDNSCDEVFIPPIRVICRLLRRINPRVGFLIDEAFVDFEDPGPLKLKKIYGNHGLRQLFQNLNLGVTRTSFSLKRDHLVCTSFVVILKKYQR